MSVLSEPFKMKGLSLKNRITMAPLYLGYAGRDGAVNQLVLDHYRAMGASGAGLIVVENAAVDPLGLGSPLTLGVHDDRFSPGLAQLAETVKQEGAAVFLQINHAGRYAFLPDKIAPSPVPTWGVVPREMDEQDIIRVVEAFARAAARVKAAGFDGVEIHGGTGYLLSQFLSSRTNHRADSYGGSLDSRMRFPLEVIAAVRAAVGPEYPVGYRFLADELLPDGLKVEETLVFARRLASAGLAYLSVMAGTHDSFHTPENAALERNEAYMASYAGAVKKAVGALPVITAGRIQHPETAERVIGEGQADLIGLARVLLADPLWPRKALGQVPGPITACQPTCSLCYKRAGALKPVFCSQWTREKRLAFLDMIGETPEREEDKN
ncbi:MAG: NADH:flavin oxidoreductase [Pseudomonadota bacterium]